MRCIKCPATGLPHSRPSELEPLPPPPWLLQVKVQSCLRLEASSVGPGAQEALSQAGPAAVLAALHVLSRALSTLSCTSPGPCKVQGVREDPCAHQEESTVLKGTGQYQGEDKMSWQRGQHEHNTENDKVHGTSWEPMA